MTRERQLVHGTPVQLLRTQTEAVAYKPTFARPSARNSRCCIGGGRCGGCVSHRQELSTSSSYCCCCEPEFDPPLVLLIESRHDAPDSPSTLCIRVPSPLAWGRQNVRELRAQRRHVLGDDGRGSILTASPFSCSSTIGVPVVDYSGSSTNCCCIIPGTRGTCGLRLYHTKKNNACLYLESRIRFYTRTRSSKMKSHTEGAKRVHF